MHFETQGVTSQLSVVYDSLNNTFSFPEAEPSSLRLERSYQRDSGKPKVLTSLSANSIEGAFEPDAFLKKNYDHVISIDTNTKKYQGRKISICTCYHVPKKLSIYRKGVPYTHLVSYVIVSPVDDVNPEQVGWSLVIENHLRPAKSTSKIAVIVDSEKDSLKEYNTREKAYFDKHYLPNNILMHYASDKDTDSLAGEMLKMCHNVSNQLYQYMLKTNLSMPLLKNGNKFHNGYFKVRPD